MTTKPKTQDTAVEPAFLGILDTARFLGVSEWTVKQMLRRGFIKAKKAGRRTVVIHATTKAYAESLPNAKFAPSTRGVKSQAA